MLKILFYGQSISTPDWTDRAMATLRAAYPNVRFDYRNLALGGWNAVILERAAARDVEDVYPDLIVFHVYGDHRAYGRIIQTFRRKTAADIIVQTDHVVNPVEPLCDTGLHLRWSPLPGCKGHVWFKQNQWDDYMSGRRLPELAARYNLAVEPRRAHWNAYLSAHHLAPRALLADQIHPNERGWSLMASLFATWFEKIVSTPAFAKPDPVQVRSLAPPRPGIPTSYAFDGNRIELLADGPLDGRMTVMVDGRPPEAWDGCWQNSRVSPLPNMPDWPALKQVTVDPSVRRVNRWRLRVSGLSPDQTQFAFALTDANGPQGTGRSDALFTSNGGDVRIDPQDWMIGLARRIFGTSVPDGATFTFERRFVCGDQPPVPLSAESVEQRHVITTGLANAHHVAIITLADDAPPVREVRAYRPSL